MASRLLSLIALLAVLVMPLGMTGSPAMAHGSSTSASSHCGEHQKPKQQLPDKPIAHCAACAALPAMEVPAASPRILPQPALYSAVTVWSAEPDPETATPPPKLS